MHENIETSPLAEFVAHPRISSAGGSLRDRRNARTDPQGRLSRIDYSSCEPMTILRLRTKPCGRLAYLCLHVGEGSSFRTGRHNESYAGRSRSII